jgi:hypothetical protein
MESDTWLWIYGLFTAVLFYGIFSKRVSAGAGHRNLARLGVAFGGVGLGLLIPFAFGRDYLPTEILAAVLIVVGSLLYLIFSNGGR